MLIKPHSRRLGLAAILVLALGLTGCESFDPTDIFPDTKKKLPGDRQAVFPEGVPGVEQGVPRELIKGNQAAPEEAAGVGVAGAGAPAAEPQQQVEEKPKPKPKPKKVAKPKPAAQPQAEPQQQVTPQAREASPWPGQPAQPQNSPWPSSPPPQQSAWPSAPPAGTFSR